MERKLLHESADFGALRIIALDLSRNLGAHQAVRSHSGSPGWDFGT
ncbi:hypothetical protein M2226_009256 [Bradyrhizobium elkanii]|nr:hypothetical protein [Bradyrhizobium elkanii]MCW2175537.1 hypothetical protein [Bradyrhizobium elkanii]